MLRLSRYSVLALLLFAGFLLAAENKNEKKDDKDGKKATVTKVDAKNRTLTVKWKDREGKEVEKTFTLAEDVRMVDETGKAVAIDVFTSGNDVLIFEREGKIREVRKQKK